MILLLEQSRRLVLAHQNWRNIRDARIRARGSAAKWGQRNMIEQRVQFFHKPLLRNRLSLIPYV